MATPDSSRRDDADDHVQRLAAWRAARARTFVAWLETHHDAIVRVAGFRGMTWPHGDDGLVVRMETERACQEVRLLLAKADLYDFDDDLRATVEAVQ